MPVSLALYLAIVASEQYRMVNSERYTTICLSQFFEEILKKEWRGILFLMTMRAITYPLKQRNFWPAKTWNWWIIGHIALFWCLLMFFYFCISKTNYVANDFFWNPMKRFKKHFGVTSVGVEKVFRKLVQKNANIHWSSWRIFWKTFSVINISFSIIIKYILSIKWLNYLRDT